MGSVSDPKLNWEESGCKRDLSRFANVVLLAYRFRCVCENETETKMKPKLN